MATVPAALHLLTVEEFLEFDFKDRHVELDNGVIRMMAGGSGAHARVQGNIFFMFFSALRGSGCRPFGPDMGVRAHDLSLRYPDVSVFCGRDTIDNDELKTFDDPKVIVEVLSDSTRDHDLRVKAVEYRALPSLDAILFVDPDVERVRRVARIARDDWSDEWVPAGHDVQLPTLGIALSHADIFARG